MSTQLHKRFPREFVEGILEAFNDQRIGEERAREMLGIRRAQLYKLRTVAEAQELLQEEVLFYKEKRRHEETEEGPARALEGRCRSGKRVSPPTPQAESGPGLLVAL